jgi:hypothetical protein
VAVTLTASSTVWFAELFWTPAIMIQAEDRCHRIGQQARVRCLYFIARGTLDEILWKLIEKKFRDLGEFVEGRENMDIALERELEVEEEDAEILKSDANVGTGKRKPQNDVGDLFDLEDAGIKEEINDLVHEEEDMLKMKSDDEDEEPDEDDKGCAKQPPLDGNNSSAAQGGTPVTPVISLLEEDDKDDTSMTIKEMRDFYQRNGILAGVRLDHTVRLNNYTIYKIQFRGQRYGFNMLFLKGRAIVKEALDSGTHVGAIIVAVGSHVLARESFNMIRQRMRNEIGRYSFATLTFADDPEFIDMFKEEILPRCAAAQNGNNNASQKVQRGSALPPPTKPPETVNLLDDDD